MTLSSVERLRRPVKRRLRRELARREGQIGLLVVGRFPLVRFTNYPYAAHTASVMVEGMAKALDNVKPGPVWFELKAGRDYEVHVLFAGLEQRTRRVRVGVGPSVLFLEPPLKASVDRGPTIEFINDVPHGWVYDG